MATFKLFIETDIEEFERDRGDVAFAIRKLVDELEAQDGDSGDVHDRYRNIVGRWVLDPG